MTKDSRNDHAPEPKQPEYEPPQVDKVVDADELAREVHYAGDDVPVVSF